MAKTQAIQRHGQGIRIDDGRLAEMAQGGVLAREMAVSLGVSRQAVYARAKALGIDLPVARITPHDAYGLSPDGYAECVRVGAIVAYRRQRDTAKHRGIEWRFTFPQWWAMWERSGKWAQRGRIKGLGGWEMSRPGDVGPYSPENVVIVPHRANMAEVHEGLVRRGGYRNQNSKD